MVIEDIPEIRLVVSWKSIGQKHTEMFYSFSFSFEQGLPFERNTYEKLQKRVRPQRTVRPQKRMGKLPSKEGFCQLIGPWLSILKSLDMQAWALQKWA